ncbi:MAG TPA: glycosyl hydrolase family 28-related protein [Verrucomicrobiae bacterium]|nr:glycosyl hydrolase family 28-related protein [Verrucomicrobiae bacterium]
MARLPSPGGDSGTWGNILNDFLSVAHNNDGTLKTIGDTEVGTLSQTKITNLVSDLAATEKTANKGQADGYAALNGDSKVPAVQLGGTGGDATNFLRGDNTWAPAVDSTASRYKGEWSPSTAYAVNDIVTHHGEGIYIITTVHTSGATFNLSNKVRLNGRARTYDVMDYGAVADNATDNTAVLNEVINKAVQDGIADGTHFARIHFPPGTYVVSSPTTKGGVAKGNAQIEIPYIQTTGKKFSLVLSGTENGSAFAHWQQTTEQRSGAVIRSTLTGLSADGTWGAPSIVGGPSVPQGSGMFSNMVITVDGISVMAPHQPGIIGWDFKWIAQAVILSASALANASPAGTPSLSTSHTNDLSIGLRMPDNLNNDCAVIVDFSCEGFYYGCTLGEHLTALRLALIYCEVGIYVGGVGGASFHGITIVNLSVEATPINIQCLNGNGGSIPIDVLGMHVETSTGYTIDDPNNNFTGTINFASIGSNPPTVRGAAHLKIVSTNQPSSPGHKTAPAVPASTTSLVNPFWRDAAVTISGGTVTEVAVDGTATGITSGTVIVPSGKAIKLTYSSAPSWNWVAL